MAHLPIFRHGVAGQGRYTHSLEFQVQQYIKNAFWPKSKSSINEYASYFRYFQWTLSILAWPESSVDGEQFAIKTYGDLARTVRCMETNIGLNRLMIAEKLRHELPQSSQDQILRSMDLAARLWLTIYVRSRDVPVGPSLSDITETQWMDTMSLQNIIQECFQPSNCSTQHCEARIDVAFTVNNLRKFCRMKIQWTANLKDHLNYDRSTGTLHLFPHKICLISHLESKSVLPTDLVAETLRTLDLLFPFGDESTQKYLAESGQDFYRTSSRDPSRATDFGEFRYWQRRLVELHELFHHAPKSVLQMWYDRRNPVQWWTFWLAVAIAFLTILFGVISSYTGFQQVVLAEKAYRLAILQACSQGNFSADLCGK
ncbi:hypothetical protein N7G274_006796 [Stereocaulon virgatum]|uniref:Uncharacterized protein n=1 Tax=Stereocaulon virgatum TaxID=373712 RepID=A0ABR4A5L0_9LECA